MFSFSIQVLLLVVSNNIIGLHETLLTDNQYLIFIITPVKKTNQINDDMITNDKNRQVSIYLGDKVKKHKQQIFSIFSTQ